MGVAQKSKKGLATKNNNRPPKNKKEHATELGGEPRLPFVLSGVWKNVPCRPIPSSSAEREAIHLPR
jgi:hypothetical protein